MHLSLVCETVSVCIFVYFFKVLYFISVIRTFFKSLLAIYLSELPLCLKQAYDDLNKWHEGRPLYRCWNIAKILVVEF